jgi:hypothetical protein
MTILKIGGTNPRRGADKQLVENSVIEIEAYMYVNFQSFLKTHLISMAEISEPI